MSACHSLSKFLLIATGFLWSATATALGPHPSPGGALSVKLGAEGLASLRYRGTDLLKDGTFRVTAAEMETLDGRSVPQPLDHARYTFNPSHSTATGTFIWGRASCTYRVGGNRLWLTMRVTNGSPYLLRGIALQPLALRFPRAPKGWNEGWPYLGHNRDSPTAVLTDYGTGTVALTNEEFGRPLLAGFPGVPSMTERPVMVASYNAVHWLSPYLDPYLNRPIPPGGSDTYRIALRFGPPGSSLASLVDDLYRRYRATYPYEVKWADRRPIGALFLSTSPPHASEANPRGWFNNDRETDTTTEAGRTRFREKLMRYADESVRVLKGMNAQGMIAWDIEGQEYPHATSYLGDPRSLPPEMEAAADAFFRKFTDAGLRVGVTLRPQIPFRRAYGEGVEQHEVPDPSANLREKVAYARKRWGCTLFYVDSNGDPNVPFDAEIFRSVARAFPDVLLMPEHESVGYYASTAPFNSFFHHGVTGTSAEVRAVYPEAFSAIYAPEGPLKEHRQELEASVRRGDILIFQGWWDNPSNALIRGITQDARH